MIKDKSITLGITGASGAFYAINLLKHLVNYYQNIHVVISDAGRIVLATEMDLALPESPKKTQIALTEYCQTSSEIISVYSKENWFSPIASGSSAPKQMVICPASMGCISAIAMGASNTLMERAADVVLKERGQLILLPREMPYSTIHLRNLLALSESGATIMPASPGFYNKPAGLEDLANFVSARVLDHLKIANEIVSPWGYKKKDKNVNDKNKKDNQ